MPPVGSNPTLTARLSASNGNSRLMHHWGGGRPDMRITIAHSKGQQQMIKIVDRAFDDAFRGLVPGPLTITSQQKSWEGSVMKFSLIARMGFIKNPISGTVEVTERDVTIDADLGMLGNLIPAQEVRSNLETRFRKLLA